MMGIASALQGLGVLVPPNFTLNVAPLSPVPPLV